MIEQIIGWIGSAAFAICAAPQTVKTIKDGHAKDITWGFLILWTIGASCCMYYVWPTNIPLIINYIISLIFSTIIISYKLRPREENDVVENIPRKTSRIG